MSFEDARVLSARDGHALTTRVVSEERELVRRARDGDARAFRAIVERHHRSLYRMATRLVGTPDDASDLVQDSFARAYTHLDRYDERYRLSTWLHRITLNACRDHLKSARVRRERLIGQEPMADIADDSGSPEQRLIARRRAARVRRLLDLLKPSYREILVLKDMHGMTYAEIKAISGTPITALKIRAVRARAKLRALLEGEDR